MDEKSDSSNLSWMFIHENFTRNVREDRNFVNQNIFVFFSIIETFSFFDFSFDTLIMIHEKQTLLKKIKQLRIHRDDSIDQSSNEEIWFFSSATNFLP